MIAPNELSDDGFGDLKLLNVSALAKCLAVSVRQAHRLNRNAMIPRPLKIGGCTRWREDEISAWMKAGAPVRSEWELKRDTKLASTVEAG